MLTPIRRELSILIRLAVPIALTQIALMAMGVVDTLMLGHVDKEALSSAALANTWIVGCQLIFQGFLFGLDPVLSQAYGARDRRKLSSHFSAESSSRSSRLCAQRRCCSSPQTFSSLPDKTPPS